MRKCRYNFRRRLTESIDFDQGVEATVAAIRRFLDGEEEPEFVGSDELYLKSAASFCGKFTKPLGAGFAIANLGDYLEVHAKQGDPEAATALVNAALELANKVKTLSLTQPALFHSIARSRDEWPSTISGHGDSKRENETIIETLGLGKDSASNELKEFSKLRSVGKHERALMHDYCFRLIEVVEVVRGLYEHLEQEALVRGIDLDNVKLDESWLRSASQLGELTPRTARRWFAVGWEVICAVSDGEPFALKPLRSVGNYREYHQLGRKGDDPGEATRKSNLRDGIRTKLRQAFARRFGGTQSP